MVPAVLGAVAVCTKNFFLSFISVLREGVYQGMHGGHIPAAQPAVDLVCLWLIMKCLSKSQNWSSVASMSSRGEGHCSLRRGGGVHGDSVQKGTAESALRHGQEKMSMSREHL